MKKNFFFIFLILFIAAACNSKNTPAPAPETTYIPGVGEVEIVPEDYEEFTGDDPVIIYEIDEDAEGTELVYNETNMLLSNSFLGVSFVIPEGWFYWHLDVFNLNDDPATTASENNLNVVTDELTGERYADLFDIGNNDDEYLNDHLGIAARAVYLDGTTLEEYLRGFAEVNLRSENVSLVHEDEAEVHGLIFKRMLLLINNPYDAYDSRLLDTFTIERNGWAIMIKFEAWLSYPDNEKEMAAFMLACVEVH